MSVTRHVLLEQFVAWLPNHKHDLHSGEVGSDCIHEFLKEHGQLDKDTTTLEDAVEAALGCLTEITSGDCRSVELQTVNGPEEFGMEEDMIAASTAILNYAQKMAEIDMMRGIATEVR